MTRYRNIFSPYSDSLSVQNLSVHVPLYRYICTDKEAHVLRSFKAVTTYGSVQPFLIHGILLSLKNWCHHYVVKSITSDTLNCKSPQVGQIILANPNFLRHPGWQSLPYDSSLEVITIQVYWKKSQFLSELKSS